MKARIYSYQLVLISIVCLLAACSNRKDSSSENILPIIDVQKTYPKKKVKLQDIAEVEYIALETTDNLLWKGGVTTFSDKYITNYDITSGNLLLFDRAGKGLKHINRQGNSGEEYLPYSSIILDEENEELLVNDVRKHKILFYDLAGNFKRVIDLPDDQFYSEMYNYDHSRLIVYRQKREDDIINSYFLLSKKTGEIEREIIIEPNGRKLSPMHFVDRNGQRVMFAFQTFVISTAYPKLVLNEISNDTIFTLEPSMKLKPLVVQIPNRASMNPEIFLFYAMDSRDYLFLYTVEKTFNKETRDFPQKKLMYNKKEQMVYEQDLYNEDYERENPFTISPQKTSFSSSNSNIFVTTLNAADLIEAYKNNKLKGKLKEKASRLDEEDNPVLMIVKMKK